ncbi:MAG: macrocin-O-methyltransferase [Candidatus Margulisbacteria bacterium]|nr:macrocin-O-methyltransferase [Candidatus Margulisiibacteriota bacterium]
MKKIAKFTIYFLGSNKLFCIPRKYIRKGLEVYYRNKNTMIISLNNPEDQDIFNLIKKIKFETKLLLSDLEAYQIYKYVKKSEKIKGDIAEVGVYKGGSAKLINEAKGDKEVYLFDTFEGLPDIGVEDTKSQFQKGLYVGTLDSVKSYLKEYPRNLFYKGVFPETSQPIENKIFSFVHLDVDLYEATIKSLEFFYPRLSQGGVLISHDYRDSEGVKKAFDEFLRDKKEVLHEPSGCNQCLFIKL